MLQPDACFSEESEAKCCFQVLVPRALVSDFASAFLPFELAQFRKSPGQKEPSNLWRKSMLMHTQTCILRRHFCRKDLWLSEMQENEMMTHENIAMKELLPLINCAQAQGTFQSIPTIFHTVSRRVPDRENDGELNFDMFKLKQMQTYIFIVFVL